MGTLQKLIQDYGFDSAEEYFEYIIESIINGQKAQARHLFHAMEKGERAEFFDWAETSHFYDAEDIDTEMHQLHLFFEEPSAWEMYLDDNDEERFPD